MSHVDLTQKLTSELALSFLNSINLRLAGRNLSMNNETAYLHMFTHWRL